MDKEYLPDKIVGERIYLKKHSITMARQMYNCIVEDKQRLSRFLPWVKDVDSVEYEINFINECCTSWDRHKSADYGIFKIDNDDYIGNISSFDLDWSNCACEIGYWILGSYEGHGHMSESVTILERVLFGMGFNRIVIQVLIDNERSRSIPERLNYSCDGVLREAIMVSNQFRDLLVYSKLKSDH